MPKIKYTRNKNRKAIIYTRYSSHSQNPMSTQQQLEACREYAKNNNLTIIKEYSDEALTGRSEEREQFQLMLSEVSILKPAFCICWKGDRLARNKYLATLTKHQLKSAGCFPAYVSEDFDTSTVEGELLENMLEVISNFFVGQLMVNIERGMNFNANNCLSNGSKKYGYRTNSDKKYIINDNEASVVKFIFGEYISGKSCIEIANILNEKGILTLQGKPWRTDSISKIIRNDSYTGIYRWRDIEIKDGIPRIISDETFAKANERLQANKRHNFNIEDKPTYPLTNYAYCGNCGEMLSGAYGKSGGNNRKYYYYRCNNKSCKSKYRKKETLETLSKELLTFIVSNREALIPLAIDANNTYLQDNSNIRAITKLVTEIAELKTKQENLLSAIEQGIVTESTKERLLNVENDLRAKQNELTIHEAQSELLTTPSDIEKYLTRYKTTRNAKLENLLNHFVYRIYFYRDSVIAVCKYSNEEPELTSTDPDYIANLYKSVKSDTNSIAYTVNSPHGSSRRFSAPPPTPTQSNYEFDLVFYSNVILCHCEL